MAGKEEKRDGINWDKCGKGALQSAAWERRKVPPAWREMQLSLERESGVAPLWPSPITVIFF